MGRGPPGAAGAPGASPEAMRASRPFHASLLRRSRFGPPAASAQPPHPPSAAMVGIGGCCEGTFCRLDAALPSLCQQIPIGAVRLGPCHPRCLSAFRYMPAKLVHQVHECSPSAIEANSREGAGASNSGSVPCKERTPAARGDRGPGRGSEGDRRTVRYPARPTDS